jgi:IS30 family transposase
MGNYTQLSVNDRRRLYIFLEMGLSVSEIAQKLCRHRSTLYRELNRNRESEIYLPVVAYQKAKSRTQNGRQGKILKDGYLRDYVTRSLKKGWSPEQISGRMKYQKLTIYVCPETIYQYVYKSNNKALYHCLPYKQSKRHKRYGRKERFCRYGDMRLITQRPSEISSRARFCHWEGDTILRQPIEFVKNRKAGLF